LKLLEKADLAFDRMLKEIAILGDMLELGINSPFWHRQIGRFLQKAASLKKVVLVGDMVQCIRQTLPVTMDAVYVRTWQEALENYQKFLRGVR
jgi:UDP-N-acetylmuramyl pentapeptide synthase